MDIKISKRKKPTVQLTSLLDLLFIMIFISLTQTHNVTPQEVTQTPETRPTPATEAPSETPSQQQQDVTITAIFHFYATASNPQVPTGTYAMKGELNTETGELSLAGVNWIQRPPGYDMVPLSGKLSRGGALFTGRVEFPGCQQFTLERSNMMDGSEVAGVWKGSYICTQGETGLTLTIQ